MALLLGERQADETTGILQTEEHVMISAGTLAEALIVAGPRGLSDEMMQVLEGIGAEIDHLGAARAVAVYGAYSALSGRKCQTGGSQAARRVPCWPKAARQRRERNCCAKLH